MPNTPAQIGEGISVWTATAEVTKQQRGWTSSILGAIGKEIYVDDEKYIDMATAVSGSGAAGLPAHTQAVLLVEADGSDEDVPRQIEALENALHGDGLLEIQSGFDPATITQLWTARKSLSHAVKKIAPLKINEDVVVPISQLSSLVNAIDGLARQYQLPIVSFGHAGNGNLHVNLLFDPAIADAPARAEHCLEQVFDLVIQLDGTLSGEHGIGIDKRAFLPRAIDSATLALMRQIKQVFDPAGIMNPGKIFP